MIFERLFAYVREGFRRAIMGAIEDAEKEIALRIFPVPVEEPGQGPPLLCDQERHDSLPPPPPRPLPIKTNGRAKTASAKP